MGAHSIILKVEYEGSYYDTSGTVWGLTVIYFRYSMGAHTMILQAQQGGSQYDTLGKV